MTIPTDYSIPLHVSLTSPLKNRLEYVSQNAKRSDRDIAEKISVTFVGARSTWKTAAIMSLCKKILPTRTEDIPTAFGHEPYNIQLNEEHYVHFECRDMKDDTDAETVGIRKDAYERSTGYILCYDPTDPDTLTELEHVYLPEIQKIKRNQSRIFLAGKIFVLLEIDWKPLNTGKKKTETIVASQLRVSIEELAKRIGTYVAVVRVPTPNTKESLDWALDKALRIVYQAGSNYEAVSLDSEFIKTAEVYHIEEKKKKECIVS
jgi:GTPase SAR1 family protein